MRSTAPFTKIKLDHLGQYYATVSGKDNPGTFRITANLKAPLVPETLQQAVNDLMRRLPFLNVRKYSGFMWYYNEILENPPTIKKEQNGSEPCGYFKQGDCLLRVLYGERHFTLEVLHSVCDGRSLAVVACSLLLRYFELLGVEISKDGLIDCDGAMQEEEAENPYARYADLRKTKSETGEDAYVLKNNPAATRIMVEKISLARIKQKAKSHGVTITEYIMAHIAIAFAKQREKDGGNRAITVNVPIDCRGFFPCIR